MSENIAVAGLAYYDITRGDFNATLLIFIPRSHFETETMRVF